MEAQMIDERFSATAFDACGLDSKAAQELADLLADEIQQEMHQVIETHLSKIIERLNSMGHALKAEYPPFLGDFSYRDDWEDEAGYHCKLRVGFDTVVSTGYSHLTTNGESFIP
jgi:hypothetical protein